MIRIFVPGQPVAKGRPRFTKAGHCFTPKKTSDYEGKMALFGSQAMTGKPPLESPLHVDLLIILPIPSSWSRRKNLRLWPAGFFRQAERTSTTS